MSWKNIFNFLGGPGMNDQEKSQKESETSKKNNTPTAEVLIKNLVDEFITIQGWGMKIAQCKTLSAILESDARVQTEILLLSMSQIARGSSRNYHRDECAKQLASQLLRRSLPITESQLICMINTAGNSGRHLFVIPNAGLLNFVEKYIGQHGTTEPIGRALTSFASCLDRNSYAEMRKAAQRARMLAAGESRSQSVVISGGEDWSDRANSDLAGMHQSVRANWQHLLAHAAKLGGSKPSGKWLNTAEKLLAVVGREEFITLTSGWFSLLGKPGMHRSDIRNDFGVDSSELISSENAEILKGLIWTAVLVDDEQTAQLLGNVAEICFKKIPGWGPRCPKVANACVNALSGMTGKAAIAQLGRLESKAKHASSRARIGKGLGSIAEKAGMTVDELQELSIPDFGMKEVGCLSLNFGEYSANLRVQGSDDVAVQWLNAGGKEYKSPPAEVKRDFSEELKAFKRKEKDLLSLLPSVRYRLEHSWLDQRHWQYSAWKERYQDHPVAATLARRLIWTFNGRAGALLDGRIVDIESAPLMVPDDAIVELWHPIAGDATLVLAWRQWLQKHRITQPFKQAHREIYILTDAERQTEIYSNRFAAHIVKQHQFAQLCQQRSWKYTLQGGWDSANTPTLSLPRWNMLVEFWVEATGHEEMAQSGIFMTVSTDQVRFVRPDGETIQLSEILPIVFSEVMRDVDLFVGVCSIGNDPAWADRGEQHTYWQNVSFGNLSASAKTRKQALEEIVPYLKIATRLSFTDKFLVVKGDLRTYKIHMGSGNILMEPNDQYLCIVPGRGASSPSTDKIFLPFEGDAILSVILSKAFMLADDKKIKDQSILSQISRRV